jgi:HTH-type transcriptional regulator, transcriptional repressor of NAD biosynthesis genes
MPNTIVLMTAFVPTVGHLRLIDFASALAGMGTAHIIVGSMDNEPIHGSLRYTSLYTYANNMHSNVIVHHLHRDVPQNPWEHENFWELWGNIVREFVEVKPTDYFVASELYGLDMAKVLGCSFMPCDIARQTLPVKGSTVRADLLSYFDQIAPTFQHNLRKTVTIFGAESCGKTTMAKKLAGEMNGWFVPEWAREYLETVGSELTSEKMRAIVAGQSALQRSVQVLSGRPFIFQDTDLFSTLGYYRLWNNGTEMDVLSVRSKALWNKSNMYIVMNDRIPFETDPLRYGGNQRESSTQYWIDLLKEFNLPFYEVKNTEPQKQLQEVCAFLVNWYEEEHKYITNFRRQ